MSKTKGNIQKTNATIKQLTKTISVHRTFSSDRGHVTKKGGNTETGNLANTNNITCYNVATYTAKLYNHTIPYKESQVID